MAEINFATIEVSRLVALQNVVNSSDVLRNNALDGLFWRMLDFTQSHAKLNTTFSNELKIAVRVKRFSGNADKLHSALAADVAIFHSGANHFSTRDLSPALRHFLNDSCRLLEPTTLPLANKTPSVPLLTPREPLNRYLQRLLTVEMAPSNSQYIIDLYELWNDYKHRSTLGLHAANWSYKGDAIIKPNLVPPNISGRTNFGQFYVDDFVNKTTSVLLRFAKYVLGH